MFGWLTTPLMLGLGALAVASPIIIHLLNKRRFQIVEWAAMDFLFDAEKKNKRRVQIENLILLMLRCLAMLLIGLVLARPFLPSGVATVMNSKKQYERVILLDDSLSARVLNGDQPAINVAKESIRGLIAELADSDETEDWLTLMTTSELDQPILANEPITRNTLASLNESIERIECSDKAADYSASLAELRRYVSGQKENVGRVVYVFSDLRANDWTESTDLQSDSAPNKQLNQLSLSTAETMLIDIGSDNDQNLAITSLRPLDLQVANKIVRFSAEVSNFGNSTATDIRVVMQVDDAQPQYQVVASLAAGRTNEVIFPFLFAGGQVENPGSSESRPQFRNYKISAEIDRQSFSDEKLQQDQLIDDSTANCAARILDGIPVLLIDGDPLAISERSETHYLKSLDVLGTGLDVEVATVMDLESVSLSDYRVIFLCNIDEASPDRIESLKQWTMDGGGLVLMPGNKVRASRFNEAFYKEGAGLSPLALDAIAGDPTMNSWSNFEVDQQVHPALRVIFESDNTSLSKVDVFSWWTSVVDESKIGKSILVPLRLNDQRNSAAMTEKSVGNGRVVAFTIPGDGDWTMWPSSPTYAPVMVDLIDYLVGSVGQSTNIEIGGTISCSVDLSSYESRVSLKDPAGEKIESVARPIGKGDDSEEKSDDAVSGDEGENEPVQEDSFEEDVLENVLYRVQFDNVNRRGFYEVGLKRHTGETNSILYASNIDPREGRLARLPASITDGDFFSDSIKRVSVGDLKNDKISGGNTEVWPFVVWLLLIVLASEQFLGWWFGRRR